MIVWRVMKDNRFAGYVSSPSQTGAYLIARSKYGQNVLVEKTCVKSEHVLAKQ